jgi:hypothetical protein
VAGVTSGTATVRVVRDDDPTAAALAAAGWTSVAESWGARLRVTPSVLTRCAAAVAAAAGAGWELLVLGPRDAAAVVALDAVSVADYPDTVATRHDVPDAGTLAETCAPAPGGPTAPSPRTAGWTPSPCSTRRSAGRRP